MVHVKRMWLDEVSEEAERKMVQEELPRALHYLKGITNFQCAVFGCTSASAANGREGMLAIEKTMQDALGCPAITAFGAVLRQIERYQPKTLSILTPYTEDVNAFFKKTMEEFGVSVAFIRGMGLVSDNDIAALTDPGEDSGVCPAHRLGPAQGDRPVLFLLHQRALGGNSAGAFCGAQGAGDHQQPVRD